MLFDVFVLEIDFALKIDDTLCLFALYWIGIKRRTRHSQGENSFILTHKMYKEKLRKSELAYEKKGVKQ